MRVRVGFQGRSKLKWKVIMCSYHDLRAIPSLLTCKLNFEIAALTGAAITYR